MNVFCMYYVCYKAISVTLNARLPLASFCYPRLLCHDEAAGVKLITITTTVTIIITITTTIAIAITMIFAITITMSAILMSSPDYCQAFLLEHIMKADTKKNSSKAKGLTTVQSLGLSISVPAHPFLKARMMNSVRH